MKQQSISKTINVGDVTTRFNPKKKKEEVQCVLDLLAHSHCLDV